MPIVDAQIHTWGTGLPSNLSHWQITHFTPEEAIALMDEAAVDAAVIHPPGWDPNSTDMAFKAVRDSRAGSRSWVRCRWISRNSRARIAGWRDQPGMLGLRYTFLHDPARQWLQDGTLDWLWAEAEKAGVPIATLATDSLTDIGRIAERHPGLRMTIDHLGGRGGLTTLKDAAAMTHIPDLLALAKYPNVAVKATGAPGYSSETYPFRRCTISASDLRRVRAAPHVLGHRHFENAVFVAAMRDDVHSGTAVVERPGQNPDHGRRAVRLVGLEPSHLSAPPKRKRFDMSHTSNTTGKPVAVVIGATSKWQSDGRNTLLAHGKPLDDSDASGRRALGRRRRHLAEVRARGVLHGADHPKRGQRHRPVAGHSGAGRPCMVVELDLFRGFDPSAFAIIRREAGDPEVLVYNAGYLEGRDLPPEKELLEYVPVEMLDTGLHVAARGPFLVAQQVLAGDAEEGRGVVLLLQQLEFAARQEADDRTVAVLSSGDDAHSGPGADRRILGARRARGQHRD